MEVLIAYLVNIVQLQIPGLRVAIFGFRFDLLDLVYCVLG